MPDQIPHVFAKDNASVTLPSGGQLPIRKGEHWAASDPVVAQYPNLFTDDPRYGMRYTRVPEGFADRPVEQATAGPGERRSTRRADRSN